MKIKEKASFEQAIQNTFFLLAGRKLA